MSSGVEHAGDDEYNREAPGRGYSKIRDIGQGSYGKATLVQDREGRMYVMKVIDISRMDSKQRKEAANEVKVLASLKHPYIVSYRESFTENRNLYIVMDYADGGDLHQRISRTRQERKVLPEEKVVRWFTEATLALKYMHDRHVLHRDLKTQNLFLTASDRLRIGDFGISKVLDCTAAFARTAVGTPYYLSPEICMERPYSFSSDVWALGCVLYELVALRVPFEAQNIQSLVRKITRERPPDLPASCSAPLRQLCGDLLHRDQGQRPSAQELLQRQLLQGEIRRMLREEQEKNKMSPLAGPGAEGGEPGASPTTPPAVPPRPPVSVVRRRLSEGGLPVVRTSSLNSADEGAELCSARRRPSSLSAAARGCARELSEPRGRLRELSEPRGRPDGPHLVEARCRFGEPPPNRDSTPLGARRNSTPVGARRPPGRYDFSRDL